MTRYHSRVRALGSIEPEWRTVYTIAATVLLSGLLTMVLMAVHDLAERGIKP